MSNFQLVTPNEYQKAILNEFAGAVNGAMEIVNRHPVEEMVHVFVKLKEAMAWFQTACLAIEEVAEEVTDKSTATPDGA